MDHDIQTKPYAIWSLQLLNVQWKDFHVTESNFSLSYRKKGGGYKGTRIQRHLTPENTNDL